MYLHTMSFSSKVSTSRCLSVASREFQYLKYINYVRSKIYLTLGILYLDQQQCTKIISGIFSQPSIKSWKVEVIVALYRPCSVNNHTPLFINPISVWCIKAKIQNSTLDSRNSHSSKINPQREPMFHHGRDERTVPSKKLKLHGTVLVMYYISFVHNCSYTWLVLLQNNLHQIHKMNLERNSAATRNLKTKVIKKQKNGYIVNLRGIQIQSGDLSYNMSEG